MSTRNKTSLTRRPDSPGPGHQVVMSQASSQKSHLPVPLRTGFETLEERTQSLCCAAASVWGAVINFRNIHVLASRSIFMISQSLGHSREGSEWGGNPDWGWGERGLCLFNGDRPTIKCKAKIIRLLQSTDLCQLG